MAWNLPSRSVRTAPTTSSAISIVYLAMTAAMIVAASLASITATPALAEESGRGLPAGMIFPIRGDSVQLAVARVTIDVPRDDAAGRVISSYRLRNLGTRPVDLEIGFVRSDSLPSTTSVTDAADSLRLRVNRRPVPIRAGATARIPRGKIRFALPDSVPAWNLTIPPFETAELDLTYRVSWSFGSDGEETARELVLRTSPARLWNGPIDDFSVSFTFDELTATLLHCALEPNDEGAAEDEAKGEEDGAAVPRNPCIESTILPAGYEWYARGPGWRFRNGRIPAVFRIRFAWQEQEEDD